MNRKSSSGAGIFLMEMMVVVCFFIVCASICIHAFAKSDWLSRTASERSQAVCAAESVAEVWKLEGMEGVTQRFGVTEGTEGAVSRYEAPEGTWPESYGIGWNQEWEPIGEGAAPTFEGQMFLSSDGAGLDTVLIYVWRSSDAQMLFNLEVSRYRRP